MDLDTIRDFLGAALGHQVTQFTVAFTIAAWIHGNKMKGQFENIISSIDNLSKAMSNQNSRITNVESRVETLEKRK